MPGDTFVVLININAGKAIDHINVGKAINHINVGKAFDDINKANYLQPFVKYERMINLLVEDKDSLRHNIQNHVSKHAIQIALITSCSRGSGAVDEHLLNLRLLQLPQHNSANKLGPYQPNHEICHKLVDWTNILLEDQQQSSKEKDGNNTNPSQQQQKTAGSKKESNQTWVDIKFRPSEIVTRRKIKWNIHYH